MSRIGKLPIVIPAGVEIKKENHVITVKGPKGTLSQKVDPSVNVEIENGEMTFSINEDSPVNIKQKQAFHGLSSHLPHASRRSESGDEVREKPESYHYLGVLRQAVARTHLC